MSENKLSIRHSKNNSLISPNKSTKLCDQSKKFDTVKAATPKAITYRKGFRDLMDTPSSSIPMLENECFKLIRRKKSDKSRIPVNKSSNAQYIDTPLQREQKIENEPQLSFAKETSDHMSYTIEKVLKSPLRETGNASEFSLARSSQKAEVKSDNSSSPADEELAEASNQATKIDPSLDETFVKLQCSSELTDEISNHATKTELPLDETLVKSDESSNKTPVCDQSSSQTGTSSKELIPTDLKGEYNGLNKDEPISCSLSKCSEENGLFLKSFEDDTFEPLPAINAENAPQRENEQNNTTEPQCAVDSKTATGVEILKQQLEDLSLKLYRNHEFLTKATQMKRILVQKMESGVGVSTEDNLCQKMEKFAEVVDTHTSQVPAIGEEIQLDGIGDRDQVYPVPWAGVKTVGFLFSLVGSDNVVSLSPREAATTINKDVLIAHYKNYLRKAQSQLDMVATIKKILLDSLELVEGRMKVIRSFVDSWGPLEDGSASRKYYEEHRSLLLECRVYLRQAADDFNLLYGRTDQYAVERSGYLDELKRFLRTQVRLFPEYKYLGP